MTTTKQESVKVTDLVAMTPIELETEEIVALLENVSDFRTIWGERTKKDDEELAMSFGVGIIPERLGDIMVYRPEPGAGLELFDGIGRIQQAREGDFLGRLGFLLIEGLSDVQMLELSTGIHGIHRRIKEALKSLHIANVFRNNPDVSLSMQAAQAGVNLDDMRKKQKLVQAGLYEAVVSGKLTMTDGQEMSLPRNKETLELFKSGNLSVAKARRALSATRAKAAEERTNRQVGKLNLTEEQEAEFRRGKPTAGTVDAVLQKGEASVRQVAQLEERVKALTDMNAHLSLRNAVLIDKMEASSIDVGAALREVEEMAKTAKGQEFLVAAEARAQAYLSQVLSGVASDVEAAADDELVGPSYEDEDEYKEAKKEWDREFKSWREEKGHDWKSMKRSEQNRVKREYIGEGHPAPIHIKVQ